MDTYLLGERSWGRMGSWCSRRRELSWSWGSCNCSSDCDSCCSRISVSKEGEDRTVRAQMSSKLNCKWPQPSTIVSVASRENKYIDYSKIGTPQVRECRSKVRPLQKGSKGSGKTRTSMDLCCCWPWFGIAKDSQSSSNGSEGGGSFLLIVVYLGHCSGAAAAAKTREAALRKTRESIGHLYLRRLEIESVRQHGARDLQGGASTSYLKRATIYQKQIS